MRNKRSVSKARYFRNSCVEKGKDYYNYESLIFKWGKQSSYQIVEKIGRGKYSEVFKGVDISSDKHIVIKVLKPVKKKKYKREIKVLQNLAKLGGGDYNIVKLYDVVRDPQTKMPALITEFIDNEHHRTMFKKFRHRDVVNYCYETLRALHFTHSCGVIHRDVKPSNIVYDQRTKELRIIDWGLAEFYIPGQKYNVRVASRYFKGPELLVELRDYDYSLDMWSFGCMFGAMIFKKGHMFVGKDNADQLVKIIKVLGTQELYKYLDRYALTLPDEVKASISGKNKYSKRKSLTSFITRENKDRATGLAVDLLRKLLIMDHQKRLSAWEAMSHPYFENVHNSKLKVKKSDERYDERLKVKKNKRF